jgi:hypothetical protein
LIHTTTAYTNQLYYYNTIIYIEMVKLRVFCISCLTVTCHFQSSSAIYFYLYYIVFLQSLNLKIFQTEENLQDQIEGEILPE